MEKVLQCSFSSLSPTCSGISSLVPMLFHNRRNLSNVSKDVLQVENTGCGLKEHFLHTSLPWTPPSLYAVPFPFSQVPLKSHSCFRCCPRTATLNTSPPNCLVRLSHSEPHPTVHLSPSASPVGSSNKVHGLSIFKRVTSPHPSSDLVLSLQSRFHIPPSSFLTWFK